jgi:hypothetical protein
MTSATRLPSGTGVVSSWAPVHRAAHVGLILGTAQNSFTDWARLSSSIAGAVCRERVEDFHFQTAEHARHTTPRAGLPTGFAQALSPISFTCRSPFPSRARRKRRFTFCAGK